MTTRLTLLARNFQLVDFDLRYGGHHTPSSPFESDLASELSLEWFRRWCLEYVLANHQAFLREVGPVVTPINAEVLVAFNQNKQRGHYVRPSRMPDIEWTSPASIKLATTHDWIALGLNGFSQVYVPDTMSELLHGNYWTFVFRERNEWIEFWDEGIKLNTKGGLWLTEEQYYPSSRYPWPLPVKHPKAYKKIGMLNSSLVVKPEKSFTKRIWSMNPVTRYKAKKHAKALGEERDRWAPLYTREG